mgnify:CR=1 FL=1
MTPFIVGTDLSVEDVSPSGDWTTAGLPTGRGAAPGLAIQSLTGLGHAVWALGTPLVDSSEPSANALRWDGARWNRLQTGTGRALLAASLAGDTLWVATEELE